MGEWHGSKYWRNQSKDDRTRLAEIPPSLEHARIHNYEVGENAAAHEEVLNWVQNYPEHQGEGVGLLFSGRHGSGKSHLSAAALRAVVRTYRQSGRFITANDYVRALDDERDNDGVLPDSYLEGNLIPYLRSVYDVVVLDDVDAIRQTSFAKRELSDLLTSRCSKKLITIVSCHDSIDNLRFNVNTKFHALARSTCITVPVLSGDYRRSPRGR